MNEKRIAHAPKMEEREKLWTGTISIEVIVVVAVVGAFSFFLFILAFSTRSRYNGFQLKKKRNNAIGSGMGYQKKKNHPDGKKLYDFIGSCNFFLHSLQK